MTDYLFRAFALRDLLARAASFLLLILSCNAIVVTNPVPIAEALTNAVLTSGEKKAPIVIMPRPAIVPPNIPSSMIGTLSCAWSSFGKRISFIISEFRWFLFNPFGKLNKPQQYNTIKPE